MLCTRREKKKRAIVAPPGSLADPEAYPESAIPIRNSTGARIKVTRNVFFFKDPEGKRKPWLDFGAGLSVDMDGQSLQPICRVRLGSVISVKAFPQACLKASHSLSLGLSGLSVKVLYELPLRNVRSFWEPPARLMVR